MPVEYIDHWLNSILFRKTYFEESLVSTSQIYQNYFNFTNYSSFDLLSVIVMNMFVSARNCSSHFQETLHLLLHN